MPTKQNTPVPAPEQAQKARKSAVDYAREAAADNDATKSTPEKPRPVSVTSTDEARAREGLKRYEVEEELDNGRRVVTRVSATDKPGALWAAYGDQDGVNVIRVDEVRPA